jgi:hypothetical protein
MANSIGGKDCMVSVFVPRPCCICSLVMWASLTSHETDLRMDPVDLCICSCWLEDVHSSACAEAKVEVV